MIWNRRATIISATRRQSWREAETKRRNPDLAPLARRRGDFIDLDEMGYQHLVAAYVLSPCAR
jgi:hypothetical protein